MLFSPFSLNMDAGMKYIEEIPPTIQNPVYSAMWVHCDSEHTPPYHQCLNGLRQWVNIHTLRSYSSWHWSTGALCLLPYIPLLWTALYQSKLYAPVQVSKAPFIFRTQDNSKISPGTDACSFMATVPHSLRQYFHLPLTVPTIMMAF